MTDSFDDIFGPEESSASDKKKPILIVGSDNPSMASRLAMAASMAPESAVIHSDQGGPELKIEPKPFPIPRPGLNRNILLDDQIELLGDVHLGKKFITNIPLDRRGEREESVWRDFEASLMGASAKRHIQVGDLFDGFIVPIEVVIRAADVYLRASEAHPETLFIIYAGNHDRSRNEARKSSFELFRRLTAPAPNIIAMMDVGSCPVGENDRIGIIPWHPFKSSSELAGELPEGEYRHIFGHWDSGDHGVSDHNLIPFEALKGKTRSIISGHEHSGREYDQGEFHIRYTGSMQPYSHAEDKNEEFYLSITPSQYDFLAGDGHPPDLRNMNIRWLLLEGESAPEIEALSISIKRITPGDDPEAPADLEVEFESFDINSLLVEALKEAGVEGDFIEQMKEKFGEIKNA